MYLLQVLHNKNNEPFVFVSCMHRDDVCCLYNIYHINGFGSGLGNPKAPFAGAIYTKTADRILRGVSLHMVKALDVWYDGC